MDIMERTAFYYGYVPVMLALIGALTWRTRMNKEESKIDKAIGVLMVLCSLGLAWFLWTVFLVVVS